MSTDKIPGARPRLKSKLGAAGLIAAGVVAGGVLAGTLSANAAGGGVPANNFSSAPVRGDESATSASVAATLTKKAEAAVSGGTVYRVESDAGDGAYEAHMKKADGTLVTVKFDQNLNVIKVEDGMGQGDPHPGGGPAPAGTGAQSG